MKLCEGESEVPERCRVARLALDGVRANVHGGKGLGFLRFRVLRRELLLLGDSGMMMKVCRQRRSREGEGA